MAFHFDPSEYDGGGGGTWLDNGEHDVTVTNHELGEANTGTEYLQLTFEDGGGRTHEERFYLSDTVLWRLAMVFKAVGFTSKIDLHGNGMIRKALYGKPLRITIAPNTNPKTGKTYKQMIWLYHQFQFQYPHPLKNIKNQVKNNNMKWVLFVLSVIIFHFHRFLS